MPDTQNFAELLAYYRGMRHLSQGQLAKAARLSRTYVYHLEHGLRQAPSVRAVRSIIRALELHGEDRRLLSQAFTELTGEYIEDEADDPSILDLHHLSSLLVENTIFPTHSLDRQWRISAWNRASLELFEITEEQLDQCDHHLLRLIYDPTYRRRFQPWEELARRLTADFKYQTRGLAFMQEYRDLIRALKRMPDYRRLSETSETSSVPPPSFLFHMKHEKLGSLALRTALSNFSGTADFSIVVYLPGNQQTLDIFQQCGWQQNSDTAISMAGPR
jgi:transcriptional regulator with XRE-family HTH domain